MQDSWPTITVIMPVYNEEEYIKQSLGSMLAQDYPAEIEVLIVDGMSTDRTRQIITELAIDDPRIALLDNPQRIVPTAMNIGIAAAKNDLIARMDGHAVAPSDYLTRCVSVMQQTGADNVGGRFLFMGTTFVARSICAAMESPFGSGPAAWRSARVPMETDTVPFGLWKRARMLELGGFDPSLIRNQDYEFNIRLRKAGGAIFFDPEIMTPYFSRQSFRDLFRQYYQYGVWKTRVGQMHPSAIRPRHLVAPVFVFVLITGVLLLPLNVYIRWAYLGVACLYLLLALFFGLIQSLRHGLRYFPLILYAFMILHIAWGAGALSGVMRWWIMREGDRGK